MSWGAGALCCWSHSTRENLCVVVGTFPKGHKAVGAQQDLGQDDLRAECDQRTGMESPMAGNGHRLGVRWPGGGRVR